MTKFEKHFEKKLSESIVYNGKVFSVGIRDVILENGEKSQRELVYHNGAVAVIPVDSQKNVYLVRQYRAAFDCEMLEIPAGKLEKDENVLSAVKRELKEETGFTAKNLIFLGEVWPAAGFCSERVYIYLATDLKEGDVCFDSDEFITTEKIKFDELYDMCLQNKLKDAKTQLAVFKAREYILRDIVE